MRRFVYLLFLSCVVWPLWTVGEEKLPETGDTPKTRPLIRAHAHNDYNHERPLLDALSFGFCSVEADVFLVDGELLVGHSRSELHTERTLESLYLDPLLERVRQNGGQVFADGPFFTLLVDIKTNAEETYVTLDGILEKYEEMLTTFEKGNIQRKAVTVVISGNRAWERIAADFTRYAGVDGRLSDLSSNRSVHLMPLISDRWGLKFTWRGQGPMPDEERAELRRIVEEAHRNGRRVRFWATPDRPSPERTALWSELLAAGVDHIGTDDLEGLKTFLLSPARFIPAQRAASVYSPKTPSSTSRTGPKALLTPSTPAS
jgi:glycerophosphoryl diester phosphodiesterase